MSTIFIKKYKKSLDKRCRNVYNSWKIIRRLRFKHMNMTLNLNLQTAQNRRRPQWATVCGGFVLCAPLDNPPE